MLKKLFLILGSLLFLSCASVAPSPMLSHWALDANSEVSQMILKCSDGPNVNLEAPGCEKEVLLEKTEELVDLARELIRADTIQAQGLDLYLHSSMIVLRVNAKDCIGLQETPDKCSQQLKRYSLVEKVAEQFFQTEKAHDGTGIDKARFWRVYYVHSNVGLKHRLKVLDPNNNRFLYIVEVVRDGSEKRLDLPAEYRVVYRRHLSDLQMIIEILR